MPGARNYKLLADIPLRLSVEVGSTSLRLSELLDLSEGSVVELDRQASELLDILVNGTLVAKGEVVTINGRFGIRVVDVVAADARLAGLERRRLMTAYLLRSLILLPLVAGMAFGALWLWRRVQPGLALGQRDRAVKLVDAIPMGATGRLAVVEFARQAAAARGVARADRDAGRSAAIVWATATTA